MKKIDKLFNNKIFLFLLFFVLIKPGIFSECIDLNIVGNIINIFRVLVSMFCVFIFFNKKLKINKTYLIMLFYIVLLLITIINSGDVFSVLIQMILTLDWIILFQYNIKYNKNVFFDALEIFLIILIFINFITILFYPNGMYVNSSKYYSNYFLGFDNNHIVFLFFAIVISFLNSYRKFGMLKDTAVLTYFISLLTVIINWSATSLVVFLIFSLLVFFFNKFDFKFKINKRIIFLFIIIFFVFVVVFINSGLYKYLIVNILKKDLTFSNRIFIWRDYLKYIKDNLLFGYGNESVEILLSKTGALHAHNIYLNIMYQGGLLLLIIFFYLLYIFKPKKNSNNKKSLIVLISIVVSFLIAFLFEVYVLMPLFFNILLMSYYLKDFDYNIKKRKNKLENKHDYLFVKRILDIIISLFGCVILVFIIPIIKILYMINGDFNSIFYSQVRIGENGEYFKLYKFRTMVLNSDQLLKKILKDEELKKEWEINQKLKNDPRVTKVGKFLRNTCIDEIPQFINVLKGDMSVIGPRPYLVREKKYLKSNLKKIVMVKPGITGYWQVNKKNNLSFSSRIKCELYYTDNVNLYFDVKILLKTIKLFLG